MWQDLNLRPHAPKARDLDQTSLHTDIQLSKMVGWEGIEPPMVQCAGFTVRSQTY